MHHWRDPVKAFRDLDRVLKPKGILVVIDGYDRPSFSSIRRAVSAFDGSIWTSMAYWIGSKDVLSYSEIAEIVNRSEIKYLSILCDEQVLAVGGMKESH
jgi:SAM-dependent methyltransferase